MQKRAKYQLQYAPMALPGDFPIDFGREYTQGDEPITRLHMHDCLEVGICLGGSGIFVVENKVFPFAEGDVNVINDEEMHLARSTPATESRWRFINLRPAQLLGPHIPEQHILQTRPLGGDGFPNIISGREHPGIAQLIRDMIQEHESAEDGYRSSIRSMVWQLMVRLHRLAGEGTEKGKQKLGAVERIAPALEFCAANYDKPVRMEKLATLCHCSLPNLRRLFHTATGSSPLEYITIIRIRMAGTLLRETASSVLDISFNVGYESVSSFNRHFKRITGVSPRVWRKRN